jgi:hypothetical protein
LEILGNFPKRKSVVRTLEAALKDEIKKYLDALPGVTYRMPVQTGYGKRFLDFVVCWRGRYVEFETKAPGKKPTPLQQKRIGEVNAAGGFAFWCDSSYDFLKNVGGL